MSLQYMTISCMCRNVRLLKRTPNYLHKTVSVSLDKLTPEVKRCGSNPARLCKLIEQSLGIIFSSWGGYVSDLDLK